MTIEAMPQAEDKHAGWLEKFRFYRDPPNRAAIETWLERFDAEHRALASKVLDNVTIVSDRQIQEGYKRALEGLEGWERDEAKRTGRWFFVGFGRPGESGPAMLRPFREANDLQLARDDYMFQSLSDLPSLKLTATDTVVFIDDFSGSGRQICLRWPVVAEMVASEAVCHLVLTAATEVAQQAIAEKTTLLCHVDKTLTHDENIFSEECVLFDAKEKKAIEQYGARADPKNPRGFGRSGLLFILSHKTPNNTIPILHVNEADRWVGLFPRRLRVAA